jgi:hypothetical protein
MGRITKWEVSKETEFQQPWRPSGLDRPVKTTPTKKQNTHPSQTHMAHSPDKSQDKVLKNSRLQLYQVYFQ